MSANLKLPRLRSNLAYVYTDDVDSPGLPELAVVTIRKPAETFDGKAVAAGSVGTIVMVHGQGAFYDIEFESPAGVASVAATDVALAED